MTQHTDSSGRDATAPGPRAGAEPRANPAARWLATLVGVALLALAGVLGRDLWYRFVFKDPANSWLEQGLNWLATHPIDVATIAGGVVIALIGLWFIVATFMPRPRTHVKVDSEASIWVRPVDIARRATSSIQSEAGGTTISSRADRKKLRVTLDGDGANPALQQRITTSLDDQFRRLAIAPRVSTKLVPRQAAQAAEVTTTRNGGHIND